MSDPTGVILRRYAQFVVDRVLAGLVPVLIALAGLYLAAHTPRGEGGTALAYATGSLVVVTMLAANWFIEVWVPRRWLGGTPGMRWLGLRVLTERGEPPRLRAYTLRWLLLVVDGYLFGLVGALVIAFSRRHQRVGDMVAHTVVVRRRVRSGSAESHA